MKTTPTTGGEGVAEQLPIVKWEYLSDHHGWQIVCEERLDVLRRAGYHLRALTPHAPAQSALDELREDNTICREAIAHALELVGEFASSPEGDDDMSQGAARATRRQLNEALGKMSPRLMMERELSPKYGLHWKQLRAERDELRREVEALRAENFKLAASQCPDGYGAESVGPNERPPFGCCLCIWSPEKSDIEIVQSASDSVSKAVAQRAAQYELAWFNSMQSAKRAAIDTARASTDEGVGK